MLPWKSKSRKLTNSEAHAVEQTRHRHALNESAIDYNILKRDVDTNRQLYEGLLQKLKEAGVTAGLRSSNVRIIDTARVPTSPAQPNIPRNIAMGFLVGLIGGVLLAMLLESIDNSVRTPEQVEAISAFATLGIIPHSVALNSQKSRGLLPQKFGDNSDNIQIASLRRPNSEIAESFRSLRTSILLSSMDAPLR